MKHKRLVRGSLIALMGVGASMMTIAAPAFAASSASGNQSLTLTGGSLSVGSVQNGSISGVVGATVSGDLPSAAWSDTTGTGAGWNGTLQLSDFVYTGSWAAQGSAAALSSSSAGAFSGFSDGVTYTVKVTGTPSSTSTPFSYTSTDANDPSGTGTATNGTAQAVGTKGLTIDFASGTTYVAGDTYTVQAGTQSDSALNLDTAATGAGVTAGTGTTSADPTLVNNSSAVLGGKTLTTGASNTALGSAVKVVSAAVNTGMGTYTVVPGAQVATDSNSFASTYTANAQYSIVTGP